MKRANRRTRSSSSFIPESLSAVLSSPCLFFFPVCRRVERRTVPRDEYRINGVNAACKRALRPVFLQPFHSLSNCNASHSSRLRGKLETTREHRPAKKRHPCPGVKRLNPGRKFKTAFFITPRDFARWKHWTTWSLASSRIREIWKPAVFKRWRD